MIGRLLDLVSDQGGWRRTLRKAVRTPGRAAMSLARMLQGSYVRLLFGSLGPWRQYRAEVAEGGFLTDRLKVLQRRFDKFAGSEVRGHRVVAGQMRTLHAELLYALVRHRRPTIVVETGVCNGLSTAVILKAMTMNEHGHLYSVDLPEYTDPKLNSQAFWTGKGGAAVPAGNRPGWLVEAPLEARWTLDLGRSQDVLPGLLSGFHGRVDVFIHDSEHSYENQLLEFRLGYAALAPGGVLIATDINWSRAFDEFWSELPKGSACRAYVDPACAVVIKSQQP